MKRALRAVSQTYPINIDMNKKAHIFNNLLRMEVFYENQIPTLVHLFQGVPLRESYEPSYNGTDGSSESRFITYLIRVVFEDQSTFKLHTQHTGRLLEFLGHPRYLVSDKLFNSVLKELCP